MDAGTQLREARERRGLTIHAIAASTKVSPQTLRYIDQNRFDRLPGGILTKGYLRAYATAVGLDPERIVGDYRAQCFGEAAEELPITTPPPVEIEGRQGWKVLLQVVGIAGVVMLFALNWRSDEDASRPLVRPAAAPAVPVEPAAPEPAAPEPAAPAMLAAAAVTTDAAPGIRIEIRPEGPCWVSASADEELVLHQLLQSGERAMARARAELLLRVGEPEACRYWLNGSRGRQLGPAGMPVTVLITEDNYETFLTDQVPPERSDDGATRGLSAATRTGGML